MRSPVGPAAAIAALAALAQEHRLEAFQLLVQSGGEGLAAGVLAARLGIPASSLSFHLAQLSRAGLIGQERRHRSIIYRADYAAMNALVGYLLENCCGGARDCAPRAASAPVSEREEA
jgi:ArsR family transcriptional regulator